MPNEKYTTNQIKIGNNKQDAQIHIFDTLITTMQTARELAKKGSPNLSVVVANRQTKGRGRLNRSWLSEEGGLWFTTILRPSLKPSSAFLVNFAASLALATVLKQNYKLDVTIKWPNDILFKDKKVAGLLSEMETDGDTIAFVNIGIGINVNNNPEIEQPNAISIKGALVRSVEDEISKIELLHLFLDEFENQLLKIESTESYSLNIIDEWKEMTSTIGRSVKIETFNDIYEGVVVDVDESGALIIMDSQGEKKRIIYGDCFYQESRDM
ncbi:MAG: biotin--[acetyl-CoA-carboxylase] ligase [Desulfamplus sp.]|nr:biotin--[acetyl-CoA-carboxylase] ligase [Desulfamplus sp.]